MATDQLDGWLARRRNITSTLGSLLDPIADKVLVLAVLVMLVEKGVAPAWMVAAIVAREIADLWPAPGGAGARSRDRRPRPRQAEDLGAGGRRGARRLRRRGRLVRPTSPGGRCSWRLVLTWVSGLDYARVAPRVLRGRAAG